MGAIKSRLVIKILKFFEKTIYKEAVHIVALSPGMKDGVVGLNIPEFKITVIPNMAKKDEFFLRPKNVAIADSFNLDVNRFNAIHFGSMGSANGLEYILDAAAILKNNGEDDINIIFLGAGSQESYLRKSCDYMGLNNVKFLGRHP